LPVSPKAQSDGPLYDAAESAPGFRVGDLIGERYVLQECIGSGAMGAVFRAHDRVLDAPLALKLIRLDPERTDNERATRRLLQEARAIARISHPGIVRVFDFGCVGGVPFIAMELLRGESLLEFLVREGPLDPVRAVRTILPVLDAVSVAHRRGVVHRDIKPENVFLASDEFGRARPKLVDFGVARLREGGHGLTRPGALLGTPDYMAPEQAQAEPDIDQRADVWACAIVLYELMTLRRPFNDGQSSYLAVLKAVVSEPARPIAEFGVNDEALWGIIRKALAKSRDERFQSVRAFGEALAFWLIDQGVLEDAYGASLRTSWLLGDHGEPPPSSVESESVTLRRARPLISEGSSDEDELGTEPPPAMAVPPRLGSPLPLAEPSLRPRPPISRFQERRPNTLESANSRQLSPLAAAIVAAVVAALATASIFWALSPRAPAPPPAAAERSR
jgi:serine/threonine protein kinase